MKSTMMAAPLSLNHLLERAGRLFRRQRDRLAAARQVACAGTATASSTAAPARWPRRCRSWACSKGDRVATLCWNHHAHLECYFGIPAAGGVMHTLNLRLAPEEIGWIAGDAQDRFLVVDDVLLPLYRQFAAPAPLREGDRVPVLRRAGARRLRRLRGAAGRRRPGRLPVRASTTRTTRWPCATRPAPPAGPRASPTRTAPPCCTRWWPAWATSGACAAPTWCCRSRPCSTPTAGACPTAP